MTRTEQRSAERPDRIHASGVVLVVILFLLPGGFFFAKGALELADRFAGRTTREATLLHVATEEHITNRGSTVTRYEVFGAMADGETFEFDDRRTYEIAEGRTPLPVRVDTSALTGRVIALRAGSETVNRVGGATGLPLAILGVVMGVGLSAVPFLMPWQTDARKKAKREGDPSPPPDLRALAAVTLAAVAVVGGTLAWDLLR